MRLFIFGYIALVLFTFLSISWFFYRFYNEKRTLFIGAECFLMCASVVSLFIVTATQFEEIAIVQTILLFIGVGLFLLFVFIVLVLPMLSIILLVVSGIQLNRKEGWSLSHALSLFAGIIYLVYLIGWPMLNRWIHNDVFSILYSLLSFLFVFTLGLFILYTLSSVVNLMKVPGREYDFIIVLGSGLIGGEKVSKLLAGRIEKGVELFRRYPESQLVFSGGQGKDESMPEAVAMKQYAMEMGVPEEAMTVEKESVNTKENLLFSKKIIDAVSEKDYPNILIVSNRYHVFRALLTTKDLGIQSDGLG